MKKHHTLQFLLLFFLVFILSNGLFVPVGYGASEFSTSKGQTVYVPAYSNVFSTNKERPLHLSATLSIRNTNLKQSITITSVDYYDSTGNRIKGYLKKPVELGPMASTHYSVKESDTIGGFGANFLVRWEAKSRVNTPVIECVMLTTRSQLGISFITQGRVIKE